VTGRPHDGKIKAPPTVALIVVVGVEVKRRRKNQPAVAFFVSSLLSMYREMAARRCYARASKFIPALIDVPKALCGFPQAELLWIAVGESDCTSAVSSKILLSLLMTSGPDPLHPVKPRAVGAPGSAGLRA